MNAVAETRRRYFTPEEANGQIPMLEETFARLLQLNAHLKRVYRRLQESGFAPADEHFEIAPPGAPDSVIGDLSTLRTLFDATREAVEHLADAGCVLKNIEHGLVDWYALKDGREVFLCWKLGEKSVDHWHEVDVGFPGRQPLSRHDSPQH
jgi:hypothetical protein